jgi:hypothetical protein
MFLILGAHQLETNTFSLFNILSAVILLRRFSALGWWQSKLLL